MDRLMDKVGQILATIPPEQETAPLAPPPLPMLPGATATMPPEAAPSVTAPPGLAPVAPNGALVPMTVPGDTANAGVSGDTSMPPPPLPPEPIPEPSYPLFR
jgi:hypothetical protein